MTFTATGFLPFVLTAYPPSFSNSSFFGALHSQAFIGAFVAYQDCLPFVLQLEVIFLLSLVLAPSIRWIFGLLFVFLALSLRYWSGFTLLFWVFLDGMILSFYSLACAVLRFRWMDEAGSRTYLQIDWLP